MRYVFFLRYETIGGGETSILDLAETLKFRGNEVKLVRGIYNIERLADWLPYTLARLIIYSVNMVHSLVYSLIDQKRHKSIYVFQEPWMPFSWKPLKAYVIFHTEDCFGLSLNKSRNPLKRILGNFYHRIFCVIGKNKEILFNSNYTKQAISTLKINGVVAYPLTKKSQITSQKRICEVSSIGFVNCILEKGVAQVLELVEKYQDFSFHIIVGKNPDQFYVDKLACHQNVIFQEWHSEIEDFFDEIDVLLVPSVWNEPFGMIQVEAQLSGIPVISSGAGGLKEGDLGLITYYDFHDVDKFENVIQQLNCNMGILDSERIERLYEQSFEQIFT